jgi:DNA-binding NtrC family response regulator
MPVSDVRLQQAISAFANDLEALIRQAALETVEQALGGGAKPPSARRARKTGATAAAPVRKAKSRGKGAKRSAEDVEAIKSKLLKYVASHAGERIEQISKALGESTKELRLPMQKLIAERAVKTKGQRRAMTYTPA